MKFENTRVYNFEGSFRGMRNPMNSWDRSDSYFGVINSLYSIDNKLDDVVNAWVEEKTKVSYLKITQDDIFYKLLSKGCLNKFEQDKVCEVAFIGPRDLELAQKLVSAGTEHAKFLRQIFVSVDITAPLYWWKEFDTYKVGTVANSTSTMHKLSSSPITKEMFEFDDNADDLVVSQGKSICGEWEYVFGDYIEDIVDMCETLRSKFKETNDINYWRALIQLLPSAYLQTRTVTMSYANLRNIYFQRLAHKLSEWHEFCDWLETLPWAEELITL